jgi:hypothetical protein
MLWVNNFVFNLVQSTWKVERNSREREESDMSWRKFLISSCRQLWGERTLEETHLFYWISYNKNGWKQKKLMNVNDFALKFPFYSLGTLVIKNWIRFYKRFEDSNSKIQAMKKSFNKFKIIAQIGSETKKSCENITRAWSSCTWQNRNNWKKLSSIKTWYSFFHIKFLSN